jgi:hypothetical protein
MENEEDSKPLVLEDVLEIIVNHIDTLENFKSKALAAEIEDNVNIWSQVYDLGFRLYRIEISPRLRALGIRFDWYDPDTTEKEDILALINALSELKSKLKRLV